MSRTTIPLAEAVQQAAQPLMVPANLSAWEQIKLRWAFGAGLQLARWVLRYGG